MIRHIELAVLLFSMLLIVIVLTWFVYTQTNIRRFDYDNLTKKNHEVLQYLKNKDKK